MLSVCLTSHRVQRAKDVTHRNNVMITDRGLALGPDCKNGEMKMQWLDFVVMEENQ